ncbi:MAG: helix-turn-helix domain-containing protein, partial [Patescibacteria group bacterium]
MYRILKQIGLTSKEAEAYEALLRLGEVPVSEIVRETGDHSQIIYRAIDGLVALGLVAVSYQQHRKFVKAEDPTTLERLEEKRLEELRLVVPELLSIQRQAHNTSIIRTSKGNEAIRAMRLDSLERLKAGDCYYAIGATGDRY